MKILDTSVRIDDLGIIEEKIFFRIAGYPRVSRGVADPKAKEKIVEVVNKWIEM